MARTFGMRHWLIAFTAFVSICIAMGSGTVASADDLWSAEIEKAVDRAKQEKLPLLLNFTGSDWCKFCIQLEKEVFSKDEFASGVDGKFVLVTLDFPNDKSNLTEEQIKANEAWSQKLGISGFPTIVLWEPVAEKPFGFLGYEQGGPEPFVEALDERLSILRGYQDLMAKAEQAEGLEKAKIMDEALELLGQEIASVYYEEEIEALVALDPKNEAGLRNKYFEAKFAELYKAVITDVTMISRLQSPDKAIEFIDEIVTSIDLPPAYLLKVSQIKFDLLRKSDRIDEASKLVDDMLAIDGVSDDTTLTQRLIVRKAYLLQGADRADEAFKVLDSSIESMSENMYLFLAKGEMLDANGEYQQAIESFDKGMAANPDADVMQVLTSAKADALFELKQYDEAVEVLNSFATNENFPGDLRADAMLHKAIILREQAQLENKPNLKRAAIISENKASEVVDSPAEKAEIQRVVEKLRLRYQK